nr:YqaJ viral recombinase family protein [Vibrio penaeicida]
MTDDSAVSLASIHKEHIHSVLTLAHRAGISKSETEGFQFQRRLGIGGTDVAPILGISPYRTPHDVWQEKTGRITPLIYPIMTMCILARNWKRQWHASIPDVPDSKFRNETNPSFIKPCRGSEPILTGTSSA